MDEGQEKEHIGAEIMDVQESLQQYYGSADDVVARHCHCNLCGSNLHFTYLTDFGKNLTQETARCPECGIRVRKMMHRLM